MTHSLNSVSKLLVSLYAIPSINKKAYSFLIIYLRTDIDSTGESKIKLDPGQMKDIRLNFKFDGNINNYLMGLVEKNKPSHWGPDWGTCALFALQKRIRTGQNID